MFSLEKKFKRYISLKKLNIRYGYWIKIKDDCKWIGRKSFYIFLFIEKVKKDKNDNWWEGMIVIVVVNLGIRYLSFVYIFKDKFDKVRELSVFCSVIYK